MPKRLAVALASCVAVVVAACASSSTPTPPTVSQAASKLDYSGIHLVYARPMIRKGHPLTVFVGAQFCPYCASMRWPLVEALKRFGTFTGLQQMSSKAGYEGFGAIATYDFSRATYQSDYLTFTSAEVADVSGNPLQSLDDDQTDLVNHLDPDGSIPFVFVAGSYTALLPFSPQSLVGNSFNEIADQIATSPPGEIGQAINREADALTAAVCKTDGARPASVCAQPAIQALIQRIP